MTQAVEDGATRPVYYESRVIKLHLDKDTLALIDATYDALEQQSDTATIEKSKKLLGQIAVATFENPSGLEAVGNSMYAASLNSGDFDGIGIDISEVGKFSIGALEMSDVDLSTEFTNMITTQRGFQANSRVITTSDTMLEELVNLKR